MCVAGGRRCPSSLPASRGGTRDLPPEIRKMVSDTRRALKIGAPEEIIKARTRTVLMYPDVVVKIPTTDEGWLGNSMEFSTFQRGGDDEIPVAPCRFEDINEELSVLVMDRVTPVIGAFSDKSMPWWVSWVDCGQVGHLPNGELVAYDL